MIWTGKKVYDPLTNIWSSGYWIKDSKGNWYPVWNRWIHASIGEIPIYNSPNGVLKELETPLSDSP